MKYSYRFNDGPMNDITEEIMYNSENISCRIIREYEENSEDEYYEHVEEINGCENDMYYSTNKNESYNNSIV